MPSRSYFALFVAFSLFASASSLFAKKVEPPVMINAVSPEGAVANSPDQIIITFNQPMVPLGEMKRDISDVGVEISPLIEGQWRWQDEKTLSFQVSGHYKWKKATAYKLKIQKGMTSLSGAQLAKDQVYNFIVSPPRANYVWMQEWGGASKPRWRVEFNQPVVRRSVEKHMFVDVEGKRYELSVVPLKNDKSPYYVKQKDGSFQKVIFDPDHPLQDWDRSDVARREWVLIPREVLPEDATAILSVEPGLESSEGPIKGDESRVLDQVDTFPEFTFLGLACRDLKGEKLILGNHNESGFWMCDPQAPISLLFSSPVSEKQVLDKIQLTPQDALLKKKYSGDSSLGGRRYRHKKGTVYKLHLPSPLKANQRFHLSAAHKQKGFWNRVKTWVKGGQNQQILDIFDRALDENPNMFFSTAHYRPYFSIPRPFSTLETQIDADFPLQIQNIDEIEVSYRTSAARGPVHKKPQFKRYRLPKIIDEVYAYPLDIKKLLDGRPGVVYGHISGNPAPLKGGQRQSRFFAQVTPYQVHAKVGYFNTLVWVTDLATGAPVSGAKVLLYEGQLDEPLNEASALDHAVANKNGVALLKGRRLLDPQGLLFRWDRHPDQAKRLFVKVVKGDNMALLPLESRFDVDVYRASSYKVWSYNRNKFGHIKVWGLTAQGIYRPGDRVHYKFFVRDKNSHSLIEAPRGGYTFEVLDPRGEVVHIQKNINLSDFGSAFGAFEVPETASSGWFSMRLRADFTEHSWHVGEVLITDFKPHAFKVETELNGKHFKAGEELEVFSVATLHSGGPYTQAEATVTLGVKALPFTSSHPLADGFFFDTYNHGPSFASLYRGALSLDEKGELKKGFKLPQTSITYGEVSAEVRVQAEDGRSVSGEGKAIYQAVDGFVGLKGTKWLYEAGRPAIFQGLVVDVDGKPQAGRDFHVRVERMETKGVRMKRANKDYVTQYESRWVAVKDWQETSKKEPVKLSFVPTETGYYRIIVSQDAQGNEKQSKVIQKTALHFYVQGEGNTLWEEDANHGLTLVPEKETYQVGETARYLIKNPYPGARALITVERYGTLRHEVQVLEGSAPVIEVPILEGDAPGFYLSVVVMSPRVEAPQKNSDADLGKPAFKMGYVKVPVSGGIKQLAFKVKTDQEVYRPRNKVKVKVQVQPSAQEKDLKKSPIEVAIAVVDEAVLDMLKGGASYYDPKGGFEQLEPLDLTNYSLLTRLVGREKFATKGLSNPGGGGGQSDMDMSFVRTISKFTSYWNPSVIIGEDGRAEIEFDAPDNLTGWRVFVLGATAQDRMGVGQTSFKVNRPTEVRAQSANQVMSDDEFKVGFSVMNRTNKQRVLSFGLDVEGDGFVLENGASLLPPLTLPAYGRETVWVPLRAKFRHREDEKAFRKKGEIVLTLSVGDDTDADHIRHKIPVLRDTSTEFSSITGQIDDDVTPIPLMLPETVNADESYLSVTLSASLLSGLEGVFKLARDDSLRCWEQSLDRAFFAAVYRQVKPLLPKEFTWEGGTTLPQKILNEAANFQTPEGSMAFFRPEVEYGHPYLSIYTAVLFQWFKEQGYKIPKGVEKKLYGYLEKLVRKDTFVSGWSGADRASLRAFVLMALAAEGRITRMDLDRLKGQLPVMSFFGKVCFLNAVSKVEGADYMVQDVLKTIFEHMDYVGGQVRFKEQATSPHFLSAAYKGAALLLTTVIDLTEKGHMVGIDKDLPYKMAVGLVQSQSPEGGWKNIHDSAFCVRALLDHEKTREKDAESITGSVLLDDRPMGTFDLASTGRASQTFKASFSQLTHQAIAGSVDKINTPNVVIQRDNEVPFYYTLGLQYQSKLPTATLAGIEVRREYSLYKEGRWVLLKGPLILKRGDIVRTDLYVTLPSQRHYVIVEAPVPGGLEPLNRELANQSKQLQEEFSPADGSLWDAQGEEFQVFGETPWSFYHKEINFDVVRFYGDTLNPGSYVLSYVAQAVGEGEFHVAPAAAREMYNPAIYGRSTPEKMQVKP